MNTAFDWLTTAAQGQPEDGAAQNKEMMMEAQEKQMEFARLVHAVFETPQGIDLMERLYSLTQAAPLMDVSNSLVQGEVSLSPADWAYIREGQNSVIRFLLNQIELAKRPPVQPSQMETEQ